MKRQLIAIIVMLAIGLQGSAVAFAGVALTQSDCVERKSCCPGGLHTASCCLDFCVAAIAIATAPVSAAWHGQSAPAAQLRISIFSSRDASPLIRPPIL
jgi:hypothetical protein